MIIGEDLPEPAELLVSEIVDNHLLGEAVLPLMEDAKARLLTPEARILPGQISTRGVLVGGPQWTKACRIGTVSGFDLSAFNRFSPPIVTLPNSKGIDDSYSATIEVIHFDFESSHRYPCEQKIIDVPVLRDGLVDGFLRWLWLGFDDSIEFENKPPFSSAWAPQLHVFSTPVHVNKGDVLRLNVEHNRHRILVWPVLT